MRVYIICNDGITLCRTAPSILNNGESDAGNCNTTVAPAGSAAPPTGVTQSRSSSPKARDCAAITEYLSGFASITRLPGRTRGRSRIGAQVPSDKQQGVVLPPTASLSPCASPTARHNRQTVRLLDIP
jgi:hypothetical protein